LIFYFPKDGIVAISNEIIYSKILAIKPAHHSKDGTAIAIFDENTCSLNSCGLLFASNQIELADRSRNFWETQVGTKQEPKTLCIEYPQQVLDRAVFIMSYLCAHLEHKFSPQIPLRPRSKAWKAISKTSISLSPQAKWQLASVPEMQQNDILDVIQLVIWASEKISQHVTAPY
jgi:hypothetical protein